MFALLAVFAVLSVIPACQPLKIVRPAAAQGQNFGVLATRMGDKVRIQVIGSRDFGPRTPGAWGFFLFLSRDQNPQPTDYLGKYDFVAAAVQSIGSKNSADCWKISKTHTWVNNPPDHAVPLRVSGKTVSFILPDSYLDDDGILDYRLDVHKVFTYPDGRLRSDIEQVIKGSTRAGPWR